MFLAELLTIDSPESALDSFLESFDYAFVESLDYAFVESVEQFVKI